MSTVTYDNPGRFFNILLHNGIIEAAVKEIKGPRDFLEIENFESFITNLTFLPYDHIMVLVNYDLLLSLRIRMDRDLIVHE